MSVIQYNSPVDITIDVTAPTGYLASITTLRAEIKRPSGANIVKTLAGGGVTIDLDAQKVHVILEDDDTNQVGDYYIALVDTTDGRTIQSSRTKFHVQAALVQP